LPSTLSAALTFHCAQQSLLPSVQAGCIAATLLELPARFAAGACAVIDLDLCRGVGGVGGRQAVRRRQGCRINGFARAGRVGQAAIVGALYIDVERGQVMVRNINRRCIAGGVLPHAVVTGDQRGHHIGRVKNESPRFQFVAVNPGASVRLVSARLGIAELLRSGRLTAMSAYLVILHPILPPCSSRAAELLKRFLFPLVFLFLRSA